jgi:hypothetical protein
MNTRKPRTIPAVSIGLFVFLLALIAPANVPAALAQSETPIIINHESTNLSDIPVYWIEQARASLHIAYGHTSHGSQLIDGMTGLVDFGGSLYAWNNGGTGGALDLRDTPFSGAYDLGSPDRTSGSKCHHLVVVRTGRCQRS